MASLPRIRDKRPDMQFRLLGPVEATADGRRVPLGRRQERWLVCLLLLDAGRVLATSRILDLMWDGDAPPSARRTLHTYVARLRGTLGGYGVDLRGSGDGYLLDVDPAVVDSHRFASAVAAARLVGDPLHRSRALWEALAMWQGPLFAGAADERLRARVGGALLELRLTAAELRAEALMECGRIDDAVGALSDLVREQPTREHLIGLAMTALYRGGRQVDALALYRQTRAVLAGEYGVEPSPALQLIHERVLRNDAALDGGGQVVPGGTVSAPGFAPPAGASPVGASAASPRSLPRDIVEFTGRAEVVAAVHAVVDSECGPGVTAPLIVSIDGMAGTGKTTVAVRIAHQVADRFPDGQSFIDLHGHSDSASVDPARALDRLLREFGVSGDRVPDLLDERAALWRSTLAGRRVLLVLDNAASAAQVAPLLPAAPGCLVLVTSRQRLSTLDGAHAVSLDVMTPTEAGDLLRLVIGRRAEEDPAGTDEVATRCGHLALALRLVAARLVHRPSWRVRDLAAVLDGDGTARLTEIAVGGRSVAAAFALSYRHVGGSAQRLFRLFGSVPQMELDVHAIAALCGLAAAAARPVVDELLDGHLLHESVPGRFRLHDLLYAYATALAQEETDQRAAPARLIGYFTATAATAAVHLSWRSSHGFADMLDPSRSLDLPTAADARQWFSDEYLNLLALARHAAARGWASQAYLLVRVMWIWQHRCGYHADCLQTHNLALGVVADLGDPVAMANLYNYRASVFYRTGQPELALADLNAAQRALHPVDPESATMAKILSNKAVPLFLLGRYRQVSEVAEEAARLYARLHMPEAEIHARAPIAEVDLLYRRYTEAAVAWRRLLLLTREPGREMARGLAFASLGTVEVRRGRYRAAIRLLNRAIDLRAGADAPSGLAATFTHLAEAHRELGDMAQAHRRHDAALSVLERCSDRICESEARSALGATLLREQRRTEAQLQYRLAVGLAEEAGAPLPLAIAQEGLARALLTDDREAALATWRSCLTLYQRLGLPDQDDVARRIHLAESALVPQGVPSRQLGCPENRADRYRHEDCGASRN